jgi:hypothetical protein
MRLILHLSQGTLFFMAIEIHRGRRLYVAPLDRKYNTSLDDYRRELDLEFRNARTSQATSIPKFRFSHDMESFKWVALHVLARCRHKSHQINDNPDTKVFKYVYSVSHVPTNERESVITMTRDEFATWAKDHFISPMVPYVLCFGLLRLELRRSYLDPGLVADMANAASYGSIYDQAIFAIRLLMDLEIPHDVLLRPTFDLEPSLQPEEQPEQPCLLSESQQKRSRPGEQPGHQRKRPRRSDSVEYYPTDAVKGLPRRK